MGKGSKNHTTTQTTTVPSYIEDAQKAIFDKAGTYIDEKWQNPNSLVSPLTGYHDEAFNALQNSARLANSEGADYSRYISQLGYSPDIEGYGNASDMASAAAGRAGQASQIDGQSIAQMANPYMRMVADGQIKQLRDSHDEMSADIGARAASAGSFGGSREAVERSQLADNYVDQTSNAMAENLAQGYNVGAGLAGQNASLADAAKNRELSGMLQAAGLDLQGVTGANAARLGQSQFDMSKASTANDVLGDVFNRQLQGGQTLAGIGDVLRGYEQQQIDVPMNLLNFGSNIVPGTTGSTTTSSQPVYNNPASSILGSALMFGGMFG
ncbi:hypothetical protein AB1P65_09535 [Roseibium alexandrii]